MIIGMVAIARNFAIGKDGKLPWHYSSDLKFFKQTTTGSTVVMGRKTYQSIGRPLPNRLNIVLSRTKTIADSGIIVLRSKDEVLELAQYLKGDVFIVGGATIYGEFADSIEKWMVSEIPETITGANAFLPKDTWKDFEIVEIKEIDDEIAVKIYRRTTS